MGSSPTPPDAAPRAGRIAVVLTAAIAALVTGAVGWIEWEHEVEHDRELLQAEMADAARSLERWFEVVGASAHGLRGLLRLNEAVSETEWASYIRNSVHHVEAEGVIGFAYLGEQNGDFVIEWYWPDGLGVEGLALPPEADLQTSVERAERRQDVVLSQRFSSGELNAEGDVMIALIGIGRDGSRDRQLHTLGDHHSSGHEHHVAKSGDAGEESGWIGIVISAPHLMASLQERVERIRVTDLACFAGRDDLHGAGIDRVSEAWRVQAPVRLGGCPWLVSGVAERPAVASVLSSIAIPVLFSGAVGVLMTLLVGWLSVQGIRAQRRAEEMKGRFQLNQALLVEAERLADLGAWELELETMTPIWSEHLRRIHEVPDDYEPTLDSAIAFYPGDAADTIRRVVENAIESGEPWDVEVPFVTAKGKELVVRVIGRADRHNGRTTRLWGALQDVTREANVKETLEAARARAEEANLAKGAFLANMSHEIRTPMTAILGFAQVMESDDDGPESRAIRTDAARTITRNGQHLLALINDILDLSRIEAGRLKFELTETDLRRVAEEVVDLLKVRAQEKSLDLRLEWDEAAPSVIKSDPVRLRQILMNLAGNAIKFTERGSVTIEGGATSPGQRARPWVRVRDTGIGIPASMAESIFDPFTQADESSTRARGGTGLGLHISHRLALLLGGGITVESDVGAGSVFTLTFEPWVVADGCDSVSSARLPLSAPTWESGRALQGRRVLLVEDGPDNQRLIGFYLSAAGAEVTIVANGALGVDAVAGGPFDLVVMDMQMPVMDGYAATREIRARGMTVPVLALTAHAMEGDRERCLRAGCDAFASKPVDRGGFTALCASLIDRDVQRLAA